MTASSLECEAMLIHWTTSNGYSIMHCLTFKTGLDFSAMALRSSMAAAFAVETRPV